MSLVGYAYSDDEESDQKVFDSKDELVKNEPVTNSSASLTETKNASVNSSLNATNKSTETTTKLSQLPSVSLVNSTLKKDSIKRSANGRIQITADLSLLNAQHSDDSDDEEERERKRLKKSMHGSRLITMLPKPKNPTKATTSKSTLTSLVPNSVANRSKAPITSTKAQIETIEKKPENPASSGSSFFFTNSDDDDDDEDIQLPQIEKEILPTPFASSAAPVFDARPVYGPSKPEVIPDAILTDSLYSPLDQSLPKLDPNKDITYKKFIASKFGEEASANDIKFVDFDMSKHLSQNTDWLKNITIEKEDRDEEDEGNAPNSTARRKNQITFLAYQAKKRETELKNQWAANRQSKNQTRAKYGF